MKQPILNITASLADLGLILPLTLGMTIAAGMDIGVALMGLGLFALISGLYYQRPIPAQPMKVIAAMAIVGELSAAAIAATGILLGVVLILLGMTGWAHRLRRLVTMPVLIGIQTALGVTLLITALPMLRNEWVAVLILLGLFIVLKQTRFHPLAFIVVVGISVAMFWVTPSVWPISSGFEVAIPSFMWPSLAAFNESLNQAFFPQIALTLSNALFLIAVLAQEYFPDDKHRLGENRFALSSGVMNLTLSPFGAMPMCHGAGGLVAYHTAGGRNGVPVMTLGIVLLLLGFLTGPAAADWIGLIPMASFGLLLLITATYMIDQKKLLQSVNADRLTIAVMVLIAVTYSMLLALLIGMLMDWLLRRYWQHPEQ